VLADEYKHLLHATREAESLSSAWKKVRLYMSPKDRRALYRRKVCEIRPQVHAGQLKLFLSELQFLSEFTNPSDQAVVVYAGAADGHHIAYLSQLFPNITFHLYDPRPFSVALAGLPNVYCYTGKIGWFDTNRAKCYADGMQKIGGKYLLISDIRTGNPGETGCDFDACCSRDMDMQLEWMRVMRPTAAMFKFRLSYMPGKTDWLAPMDGKHLMYGIFATKSATELRLVSVDPDKMCTYDNTQIEECAYYFNSFTRVCQYKLQIPGYDDSAARKSLNMDYCWDCCAMREVCLTYLNRKRNVEDAQCETVELICTAVSHVTGISAHISSIVAEYISHVSEQELHTFMHDTIQNCGSGAVRKMSKLPHGDLTGEQWIDRMDRYRDAPLLSKKNKKRELACVMEKIRKMYSDVGNFAPPVGNYLPEL
jgi:hypothetical protein